MSFQTKKFESIVASMINWVSSNTDKITDFNIGSVTRTILEAVAIELEELYYQLLKAVEEAIEEAIYRTFNFPRNPAQRSTGNVRFTRAVGNEDLISIPQGSLVATQTEPVIYFETQANESMAMVSGTATGAVLGFETQSLIDTSKNFVALGIVPGAKVKNITDGGETPAAGVTSITSSSPSTPYDTLNFGSLTNGASFSKFIGKVYYEAGGAIATINSIPVAVGGGYTNGDIVTLVDALGVGGTATLTVVAGVVTAATLTTTGTYYTTGTKATTGGTGAGCTITITSVTGTPTEYTTAAQFIDSVYFPTDLVLGFDYLYLGFDKPFASFGFFKGGGVAQAIAGALSGEYWNGSSWQPLSYFIDETKGTGNIPFSTDGNITWSVPANWTRTIYSTFNLYWVRLKSDTTLTAGAQGDSMQFQGDVYKVFIMNKDVAVQCQALGTVGNVGANTITRPISSVAGVGSVTNPAAFGDGVEEETDSDRKVRFALYIQSLARATRGALEYAARTVDQVVAAKAVDDVRATVLRFTSPTTYDDISTPMRVPGDAGVPLFISDLTDNAIYFGAREIFEYVNIHLVIDGVISTDDLLWEYWDGSGDPMTDPWPLLTVSSDGTDPGPVPGPAGPLQQNGTVAFSPPNNWEAAEIDGLLRMWIRLRKDTGGTTYSISPTGDWCSLPPAFGYVDLYAHDGSGSLNATLITAVESAVELYRGCGIIVNVKPPVQIIPTITARIFIASNYDPTDIALKVRQLVIDWLNAKVLSEDLYVADLYQLIMNYNDQAILNCVIDECSNRVADVVPPTPEVKDLIVWSAAVVRPDTLAVTPIHGAITITAVGVD